MAIRFITGLILLALMQGCAKIGQPSGGPEDVLPPEFVSGTPANKTVNFADDQIDITFDEYIQLKDQNREILISPPMNERPVIRVREKSIRISFSEEFLPQTTYTINFGKSISDLNEGNLLPDFEFVLSTGDVIDSLSVTGKVTDAFTHESDKETRMLVMLYDNLSDSAPMIEIPRYYTKASEFGLFAINNIRSDTFRIIAINDVNNNLRYDKGLESVAFSDSLIVVNPGTVKEQTFIKDTIKIITPVQVSVRANRRDTLTVADTIIAPGKKLNALSISLYSFMEQGKRVMVTSRSREIPEQFRFTFNRPLFDTLEVEALNFPAASDWILPEYSVNKDTLSYWITDTLIAKLDTLRLRIAYLTADTAGIMMLKSDTVRLRKPVAASSGTRGSGTRRSRGLTESVTIGKLILESNIGNRGSLNLNSYLTFTASRPIKTINPDSIELAILRDTTFVPNRMVVTSDTANSRKFSVNSKWEPDEQYRILLKPGTIYDIYGRANDSTEIRFSTRDVDFYGRILLNFSSYVYPVILQVRNEKGSIVRSSIVEKAGIVTFDYLPPGKYSFKAIHDVNGNGKWDTGDLTGKIQPEKTFISGSPQQLRSNWDWEPTWALTENSIDY